MVDSPTFVWENTGTENKKAHKKKAQILFITGILVHFKVNLQGFRGFSSKKY